jgi:hypothetical protein
MMNEGQNCSDQTKTQQQTFTLSAVSIALTANASKRIAYQFLQVIHPQLHHQTRNHHSTPPLTTFFNPANPPLASSWTPMIPSPHPPNLYRTVHPPQQHQVTT